MGHVYMNFDTIKLGGCVLVNTSMYVYMSYISLFALFLRIPNIAPPNGKLFSTFFTDVQEATSIVATFLKANPPSCLIPTGAHLKRSPNVAMFPVPLSHLQTWD